MTIRSAITADLPAVCQRMESGARLTAEDREDLLRVIRSVVAGIAETAG